MARARASRMVLAMRHPDDPGAGAAQRRALGLTGREKAAVVMREFHHGTLRSRSGEVVTDEQQAKAIAMSEGRKAEAHMLKKTKGKAHKKTHKATHKTTRKAHKAHVPAHHSPRPPGYGPHSSVAPASPVHHKAGLHKAHSRYAKGAPASEWDRLWHRYVEANEKGSLNEQIHAGKALLRFDRIHGTPPMQHVVHMLREARELLAKHAEAFKEAKKLKSELQKADGHVKRHRAAHGHAGAKHRSLALHKGKSRSARGHSAKARRGLF